MTLQEQYRDKGLFAVIGVTATELRDLSREELEALIDERAEDARKTARAQLLAARGEL